MFAGKTATRSAIRPQAASQDDPRDQEQDAEGDLHDPAHDDERAMQREIRRHDAHVCVRCDKMPHARDDEQGRENPSAGLSPALRRFGFIIPHV